jgi:sugar phosphate isomerase/epimerase
MRVHDRHLFYCAGPRPGEDLASLKRALAEARAVKARVCPDAPFAVGLRLSIAAAEALDDPYQLSTLRRWLDDHGLYVYALDGVRYHRPAHDRPATVGQIDEPDWLDERRAAFALRLARICAALTPDELGSVTTAPGGLRVGPGQQEHDPQLRRRIAARLRWVARALDRLREGTGKTVMLALELEPNSVLARASEAAAFFRDHLSGGADEPAVRRHLGVCLDACHLAVELEPPQAAIDALQAARVPIARVQLAAALRVPGTAAARAAVARVGDHARRVTQRAGELVRRLPARPADGPAEGVEWLVDLHVPVFLRELGPLRSSQDELCALIAALDRVDCAHLEVETGAWAVLPPAFHREPLDAAIARELLWARERLVASDRRARPISWPVAAPAAARPPPAPSGSRPA